MLMLLDEIMKAFYIEIIKYYWKKVYNLSFLLQLQM